MPENVNQLDFTLEHDNLYREQSYTDLKAGSIRRLLPVKPDGSPDESRSEIFVGTTQLMTNEGPLPVQARLMANSFKEALAVFPETMRKATMEMIAQFEQLQQKMKAEADSRIIVPGQ
ncbi:MAG: cytoplasmic protein [Desulfobacterales bacterium]|jgi:hypothetical protein